MVDTLRYHLRMLKTHNRQRLIVIHVYTVGKLCTGNLQVNMAQLNFIYWRN